jgi:hypothetical protein
MADGGLPVLVGVASVAQARALATSWRAVASALAASPVDVFADCGRLTGDPVTGEVRGSCGRLLVVGRATPAGGAHTRAALELVRGRPQEVPVSVVVIGAAGAPAQIAAALRGFGEPDLLGPLAFDPAAAAAFSGRWTRRLDRSPLVVSARQVARAVDTRSTRPSQAAGPAPVDQPAPLSEVG